MVLTLLYDYLIMGSYVAFLCYYFGGDKFTPLSAGVGMLLLFQVINIRDAFYGWLFPQYLCQAKLDFKVGSAKDLIYCMCKLMGFFTFVCYICSAIGLFHFALDGWYVIPLISFEYWTMSIAKDATTMKYIHKLMHQPKYYWLHKNHHRSTADTQVRHVHIHDCTPPPHTF